MTRTKSKRQTLEIKPPKTLDDCNSLIAEMSRISADIKLLCADTEKAVTDLKENCARLVSDLEADRAQYHRALSIFAESNPNQFESPRSIGLDAGRFGFRKTPSGVHFSKDKAEEIGRSLAAMGNDFKECVRVTHTVLKTGLKALDPERRKTVEALGIEFDGQSDTFFVRPDELPVSAPHEVDNTAPPVED